MISPLARHSLHIAVGAVFLCQQSLQAASPTLPSGGNFVAGAGGIHTAGNAVTINQSTLRGIIDWNTFSIGQGGAVVFRNGSGATLNRVTGGDLSSILGSLTSTGSVYVINPAGLLIGPHAHVKTGGDFVASTLSISDDAFLKGGSLSFQGSSKNAVVNLGNISSNGGSIFLIGHNVTNGGSVSAANGTAGLGSGSEILIKDATGDQRVFVKTGAGDVINTGVISAAQAELKAKNGNIYALAGNNGGTIKATGTAKINGQAWLIADGGTTTITGAVSAQNRDGTGGHVETSGANLKFGTTASVTTGKYGSWLLDPDDLTIDSSLATIIESNLNFYGNVTEQTTASGTGGVGDINVQSNISWNTNSALTLSAYKDVNIASGVTIANTAAGSLTLRADNASTGTGTVNFLGTGKVDFSGSTGFVSILYNPADLGGGKYNNPINYSGSFVGNSSWPIPVDGSLRTQLTSYMLINNMTDLQNVSTNLAGTYGLGTNLDASTSGSFTPLGTLGTPYSGEFDGQGNTISNLTIAPAATTGLFAYNSGAIRNVGLSNVNVSNLTGTTTGGLVGQNSGYVDRVFVNGQIAGSTYAGGIVGVNASAGQITDSYAMGEVSGINGGGVAGQNQGTVTNSYSTALNVALIGQDSAGTVTDSYWETDNSGVTSSAAGGLGFDRSTFQLGIPPTWNTNIWNNYLYGFGYPYLKWQIPANGVPFVVSGKIYADQSHQNPLPGQPVHTIINGVDVGQTVLSGADGYYYFMIPTAANNFSSGGLITYLGGNVSGIYGNAFSDLTHQTAYSLPITRDYLMMQSENPSFTATIGNLTTAVGGLTSNANLLFSIGSGNILSPTRNLDLMSDSLPMVIDQPIQVPSLILEGYSNLTQSSPINVTQLSLLASGFNPIQLSLVGVTPLGMSTSNYTLTNEQNQVSTLASAISRNIGFSPGVVRSSLAPAPTPDVPVSGSAIQLNAAGNLTLGITDAATGVYTSGSATIKAAGSLSIQSGILRVEADGTGIPLVLTDGTTFTNNSGLGSSSFTTPSGNWQLWSQNPANDVRGGIAYNFKQYAATYGITEPAQSTGNGVFYTTAPVLIASMGPVIKQYDGNTAATINPASYSVAGIIDNDTVTITGPSNGTYSDKNAGTGKTVTANGLSVTTVDGAAAVYGYQFNSTLAAPVGTITPAPVVVSVSASNKVYDGTTAATATHSSASGFVDGDAISLAGSASYSFADKNAGNNKAVSESGLALSGADAGNYTLSVSNGSANITPAPVTLVISASNKVYDGTTAATAATSASGFVNGDSIGLASGVTYSFADKNAGNNKVVSGAGLSLVGADAGNYTLSLVQNGNANITPASLLYVADTGARSYGTDNPGFSGTVTGVQTGDTISSITTGSAAFSSPAIVTTSAGTYAINGSGLTLTSGNYTLAQAPGNATALSINPITIVIGSIVRYVGQPNPTFTVQYSGPSSDYLRSLLASLILSTNAPATDVPGTYQITAALPAELAGSVNVQNGTFTIRAISALPAVLESQFVPPPSPLPPLSTGANSNLLPGNAVSAFQISIQPSTAWNSFLQDANTAGALSNSSFVQSSPDGRTEDDQSTYAAGAKP